MGGSVGGGRWAFGYLSTRFGVDAFGSRIGTVAGHTGSFRALDDPKRVRFPLFVGHGCRGPVQAVVGGQSVLVDLLDGLTAVSMMSILRFDEFNSIIKFI